MGGGVIIFGKNVNLGVERSSGFYSGYGYIDARNSSMIKIDDDVWINNNCVICSEGKGISIAYGCLIGNNCHIYDSDFHDLHPDRRTSGIPQTAKVTICENVFIGSNVTITKGVTIGKNSVIGANSVVVKSIPENVIAAGNPARVIRSF